MKNGITADFHDESHHNRYLADRDILALDPGYGYPEGWNLPIEPKIVLLDKVRHGGEFFNKMPGLTFPDRVFRKFKFIVKALNWYFRSKG
jgi:hypothetical protein